LPEKGGGEELPENSNEETYEESWKSPGRKKEISHNTKRKKSIDSGEKGNLKRREYLKKKERRHEERQLQRKELDQRKTSALGRTSGTRKEKEGYEGKEGKT